MIRRFLDYSSGHLSPETWTWLDARLADEGLRDAVNAMAAMIAGSRTRYGWFVFAPEDPHEEMPGDLRTVCASARRQGAEYVLFDCDAPTVPGLQILHPDFTG